MSRSLLILVLPVVIAQIIAVTVFWDNHWDKMTARLANAVVGEISILVDRLEKDPSPESFELLSGYIEKHLSLRTEYKPGVNISDTLKRQTDYGVTGHLILSPILQSLKQRLVHTHNVLLNEKAEQVIVQIQLKNGLLRVFVPQSRLYSSSGYVFIILLVGSSFTLLMISILFLRNQIRPIRKLAAAASLMGKGRGVTLGKIRGAKEVRQAGEAFETMQRRIRRQLEQRTAMLAGVSHDLRTPLTRLKLNLSLLEDQKEAEDMQADIDEMQKMIDAYLEFARGQKIEEAIDVEIVSFLNDIIGRYKTQQVPQIELNSPVPSLNIAIQPVNFRRAIENILSNAARYATIIRVSLDYNEERLIIIIEDNGTGISEDQYEEAFKPFVRLDPSRSKNTGGAGLGLSVSMDIILSHGGKISLGKSEALNGLLVRIRLPF